MTSPLPATGRRTFQQAVAHVLDLPPDTHPDELTAHIALLRARAGDPPPANEWATHMRSLLGKQVEVTLQTEPERHVVTGQLLWFDEGGEVALRDDEGYICRGWPNLGTRALGDDE